MLKEKNLKRCREPKLNELKTIKTGGGRGKGKGVNCHTLAHACSPWSAHSPEVIPGPAQAWETRRRSRATSIHLIPVGCVQDGKAKLKISRGPFLKIAWGLQVRRARLLAEELWGFVSWCSNCVGHHCFCVRADRNTVPPWRWVYATWGGWGATTLSQWEYKMM